MNIEDLEKLERESRYVSYAMKKFGTSPTIRALGEALSNAEIEFCFKIKYAFSNLWQEYLHVALAIARVLGTTNEEIIYE